MPLPQRPAYSIAAVAILGAGAALFVYNAKRNAEPVEPAEAAAIAEQNERNTQIMQHQLDEQLEDRRAGEQERLDSPLGQALFANCLEWQEFVANHPSEDAATNRDKACREYDDFLRSDEVRNSPEDP